MSEVDAMTLSNTITNKSLSSTATSPPNTTTPSPPTTSSSSASKRAVSFQVPAKPSAPNSTSSKPSSSPSPSPSNPPQASSHTAPLALKSFSYHCPGLHGPNCQQDIRRMALDTLLSGANPTAMSEESEESGSGAIASDKSCESVWKLDRSGVPGSGEILIPLMQRRYCWGVGMAKTWWRDCQKGAKHDVGKIIFSLQEVGEEEEGEVSGANATSEEERPLLCIDGQQRLTTTLLLLAASRDCALEVLRASGDSLSEKARVYGAQFINSVNARLFLPSTSNAPALTSFSTWVTQLRASVTASKGDLSSVCTTDRLPYSRLTPSYVDRCAFYEILVNGLVHSPSSSSASLSPLSPFSPRTYISSQFTIYNYFLSAFRRLHSNLSHTDPISRLNALSTRVSQALSMSIMFVRPLNRINIAQVFLWYQEKSLLSMGALLFNPTPGIDFTAGIMVRNHLLTAYMSRSMVEQRQVLLDKWLNPIARKFALPAPLTPPPSATSTAPAGEERELPFNAEEQRHHTEKEEKALDNCLRAYLQKQAPDGPSRYRGGTETMLTQVFSGPKLNVFTALSAITLYTKFVSFFEEKTTVQTAEGGRELVANDKLELIVNGILESLAEFVEEWTVGKKDKMEWEKTK